MIREMSYLDCVAVVKNLDDIHWREVDAFTDFMGGDRSMKELVDNIYSRAGTKLVCLDKQETPVILSGLNNGDHGKIRGFWWLVSKSTQKRHWKEVFDCWFPKREMIMEKFAIHRVEVMTLDEDHGEAKYLIRAGFSIESVQKKRGRNGEDARLWVKLQGGV